MSCLSLFPFPLFAQSSSEVTSYASILLSLLVVVALIFMLAYIMRRFNVTQSGSAQMKVVASMMVGSRERVLVLEVGEEQHLVGITAQNINHLARLETPIKAGEPGERFKSTLGQLMQAGKGKADNKDKDHD